MWVDGAVPSGPSEYHDQAERPGFTHVGVAAAAGRASSSTATAARSGACSSSSAPGDSPRWRSTPSTDRSCRSRHPTASGGSRSS